MRIRLCNASLSDPSETRHMLSSTSWDSQNLSSLKRLMPPLSASASPIATGEVASALFGSQNLPNLFRDGLSVFGGVTFPICKSEEVSCRVEFPLVDSRRILRL